MRMKYRNFNADDLQGTTLADYLVNVEADFEIVDGGEVVYSELAFPVAELARELAHWVTPSEEGAEDFHFVSLSFEDPGAVKFVRGAEGWIVGSALTPDRESSPCSWRQLTAIIEEFVGNVRRDMEEIGIDPIFVLGMPA
ncbi:hypothetical protein GCM10010145_69200 [Streptomyces ruber]|uniref:DUF7878 domain-containing protein n=2 Tax=Streptomyces TaxID=1883 RepID=A0A918BSJ2_9ACTN|nr:hypothetical protein [Streptomyces ruber]GGQ89893.1 hypothetical protein GCM10010145_69200 [Streptomyces ruber]